MSRPTIYRRIEAGELHPFKVSTKTIRIAVEELLRDCEIEQVPNSGDFSVPIKLEAALELYQVSRTKFFNAVRKAGIRPKHIRKVDYFPKKDLDRLFPAPLKYNPDEWYTVEELAASTGMTAKYVRDFARKHNLKKLRVGQIVLINRRDWNLNRFTKGQLEEDFFTVDQAKKHYHIGQEHFYEAVNAAGLHAKQETIQKYIDILKHTTPGKKGEIQLTDALRNLPSSIGLVTACTRYDIGDKPGWMKSNLELSLQHPEFGPILKEELTRLLK